MVAYQYCFGKICIIITPASILGPHVSLYNNQFGVIQVMVSRPPPVVGPENKAISHPWATNSHLSEQIIRFDSFDQEGWNHDIFILL